MNLKENSFHHGSACELCREVPPDTVFISWGGCHEVSRMGWRKHMSSLTEPDAEVRNPGVDRAMFPLRLWVRSFLVSSRIWQSLATFGVPGAPPYWVPL